MPPSRSMRIDDEMSVQEPETTHASVAHPSASETIPSDVLVASVEPEDSVPTTPPRRLLFKRPPIPLDRVELPKRTRGDEDDHSTFSAYHHDLEKVSENVKNGNASALEQGCLTCWTALGLRCKLQLKRQRTKH